MLNKIFKAMNNSRGHFSRAFKSILSKNLSSDTIDKIEEELIQTDMGYDTVHDIIKIAEEYAIDDSKVNLSEAVKTILINRLPENIDYKFIKKPSVIMLVGVNGSGKTTSAAKLAFMYKKLGLKITLIAADTYRAAAIEQLKIWSELVDCKLIYNETTSKPSSVIFDGLESAQSNQSDLVIIDTAGRLHTSDNLMSELDKMYKVVRTRYANFNFYSYITVDATMGQNSFNQAKIFNEKNPLDGIILTKLDGTAKGGIVFSLFNKLNIPVRFLCTGENLDDIETFNKELYVSSLIGSDEEFVK